MKYLDMTEAEFRLIRAQAARSWATNIVRSIRHGAPMTRNRRYALQAASWAAILRKLGVLLPEVDRSAVLPDWGGPEVRRLVRIICETKSSPARAHNGAATEKRNAP